MGYVGTFLIPRSPHGDFTNHYGDQKWEETNGHVAYKILEIKPEWKRSLEKMCRWDDNIKNILNKHYENQSGFS
jgi:hypothetical protein